MKALILAGGLGTRLQGVVSDRPKPMALIAGKPFLEHQIHLLKKQGVTEIILAVHHMADKIKSYFGNGRFWHVNISYSEEEIPLGTGGAIKNAEKFLDSTFLVINGDTYSPIDLKNLIDFHKSQNSLATLSLKEFNDISDYGGVILIDKKITQFIEKENSGPGIINRGVYVFEPEILNYIPPGIKVSLESEIFPNLVKENKLHGHLDESYFIDIGKPETYKEFKKEIIKKTYIKKDSKIRDVMEHIVKTGVNLALIVDDQEKLLGVLNDNIIKDHLIKGGNLMDPVDLAMLKNPVTCHYKDPKEKIENLLISGINRLPILDDCGKVVDVEFRVEILNTETYPIIRGMAPLRVSFSGGGTDIPLFFEKNGGVVISSTIDKYCYATLKKRADDKIVIYSDIFCSEKGVLLGKVNDLKYDGNFDLIKAVVNITKPDFGFELYLHNDVPPERGLGSSASFSVLLIHLISQVKNISYDSYKLAELAYKAERDELKIKGGWQDQYAAITGGFNYMEFNKDNCIIYPLRLKNEVLHELNERLVLCYVGKDHKSGEIHEDQQKQIEITDVSESLFETKKLAIQIKDSLLTNNLDKIGELLNISWQNKKKFSGKISNPLIDNIYESGLKNGALGGKLLGAGGGGYILFYFFPENRNKLINFLKNKNLELLNFKFETQGVKSWFIKK